MVTGIVRFASMLASAIFLGTCSWADADARSRPRPTLSCDTYNELDRKCHCAGADGYLISYGRKYCDRFLGETGWTPAGAKWRDETLSCLQHSLSQRLESKSGRACDCKKIKALAFETHVRCYTQADASVCRLPLSDLSRIYGIIDAGDFFGPDGMRQFLAIARTCLRNGH